MHSKLSTEIAIDVFYIKDRAKGNRREKERQRAKEKRARSILSSFFDRVEGVQFFFFPYRNGSARTPLATGDARSDMPMEPPGPAAGVMV